MKFMKVGKKATGQSNIDKMIVSRHGSRMTIRGANALEKTIETRVRRKGKDECKSGREEV